MSNFNNLLDASVDLGRAWADRHTKRPAQPAMVLESEYLQLRELFKQVVAQRDLYADAVIPFFGKVLVKEELRAHFHRLAKERGIVL